MTTGRRIDAYTKPSLDGKGVSIDVEGMAVDLITVMKANGLTRESFIEGMGQFWDAIEVQVTPPGGKMQ